MAKIITFPTALNDTGNWLFEMNGVTNNKDSRNGNADNSSVPANEFDAERGDSHIASSGIAVHYSVNSGWKMSFAQSIDKSRYFSSRVGFAPYNSDGVKRMKYSPLYDGICNGFTANYKKYDAASAKGDTKNRYRVAKFVMIYRNGDIGYTMRDCSFTGGQYYNLTNFVNDSAKTGVFTGSITVSCPAIAQPIGLVCQLQTEGGAFGQSGSYITIYNLKFTSNQNKEAIMHPFQTYENSTPNAKRAIWTN